MSADKATMAVVRDRIIVFLSIGVRNKFTFILSTTISCNKLCRSRLADLFDRYTFGQITWLVDIRTARARRVIRQQLQRHHMQDG